MDTYYIKALRDSQARMILALQELILMSSVEFYKKRDIHWLSAPITTGTISSPMGLGSDSMPVKISLDNHETYLADSMQFLLEYGCRIFDHGCWYIMPSFRGEAVDKRHLKQFFHSEAEIPGNLDDVMNLVDDYIKFLIQKIQNEFGQKPHLQSVLDNDIPRVTFDEAEKILNGKGIEYNEEWRNISAAGELALIQYFNGPVWVKHYDKIAVPFYQRSIGKYAKNADLFMGIGETVGCGERWNSGKEVLAALKSHNVNPTQYQWDEIFHNLDNSNKITLTEKHLIGDPIFYENEETLLEIFLNFHLETYFNQTPLLEKVIDDIKQGVVPYRNRDDSFTIPTGCYIYEIKKR